MATKENEVLPISVIAAEPLEKLVEYRKQNFIELIQTNPKGWSEEIADVKKKYPELSTVQSFSQEAVDSFDSDTYDNFVRKTNAFEVAKKLDLKPLSVTTGLTYDTASPSLKSFAVTAETSLTNFLSAATKLDDALFDLPGEIKSTASLIANGAQTFVGHQCLHK